MTNTSTEKRHSIQWRNTWSTWRSGSGLWKCPPCSQMVAYIECLYEKCITQVLNQLFSNPLNEILPTGVMRWHTPCRPAVSLWHQTIPRCWETECNALGLAGLGGVQAFLAVPVIAAFVLFNNSIVLLSHLPLTIHDLWASQGTWGVQDEVSWHHIYWRPGEPFQKSSHDTFCYSHSRMWPNLRHWACDTQNPHYVGSYRFHFIQDSKDIFPNFQLGQAGGISG